MKKITKIIPIVMLITISSLILFFINYKEASDYLNFENLSKETMNIKYNNDNNNLAINLKEIQKIAKENKVIIVKTNIDNNKKNGLNVYVSLDNINDLYKLLEKNFNLTKLSDNLTEKSFFSTFNHKDKNQIGLINDLFGDNYYTYYLMNEMISSNQSLFGNYYIFYEDFNNYSNFINDVNNYIGYDTNSLSLSTNIESYIIVLIVASISFLLLFYFIFQIFEYNNNAKKIGCMKLLGFDNYMINKNMIKKTIWVCIYTLIVILLSALIFIKNISILHILILICTNLLIIFITYLISYISCVIINKSYTISNILKKQDISTKISKVSYMFKSIMTIMIICFSIFALDSTKNLQEKLKAYNSSKNLLDYGVFQSYTADQPEIYDYDKQNLLYKKITNNIDTIYAQFQDYSQYTDEDFKNTEYAEEKGELFVFDSIDINYLKKENIKIYDFQNNEINPETIKGIYYLFPKSKQNRIDSFKLFHKDLDIYYKKFNDTYKLQIYLYDNQKLDTYQINYKYIDSPILRVIDSSLKYPSFYDGIGVSFFGEQMLTGLKIKLIDGDKEKTLKVLEEYIEESGLTNLLNRESFITFSDYFNDEIIASKTIMIFFILIIVLILIVYFLISFQLLKLYINGNKKRVLVKKLLGYDDNLLFENVYSKNMKNTIFSIVVSGTILLLVKKLSINFIFIMLILLILDFITTTVAIKTTKLSAIFLGLKGGSYD